jgi:hypothetical protein
METILIFIVLIVLGFMFYVLRNKSKSQDSTRPSEQYLPTTEVINDRIVMVNNASLSEMQAILTGFCDSYNQESFQALPRLTQLNDRQHIVTFPYDISFEIYCFVINYISYPTGFDKSFDVTAWTTTRSGETWITEQCANKKVMIFLSANDTEYDNVFMTTIENIPYKLDFGARKAQQLSSPSERLFRSATINLDDIKGKTFQDFN